MADRLIMKVGEEMQEIPLAEETVTIGRAEENTVTIFDPKSSRKHCSVVFEGEGYTLVDHDSRNGTQVNGKKTTRHPLQEGDVIAIGQTTFLFHGRGWPAGKEGAPSLEEPAGEEPAGEEPAGESWVLEMETPDGNPETFPLEEKVTIGRNPKNRIRIQDSKASNFHCEIVREGPGYLLRDLNSTNGTRVDGKLVDELDLYHGSVIAIGKTHFTIRNLAIPSAEAGFETGPVGGAEFATFSRKRRSFPIGLIVALAVVAGGLYALKRLASLSVSRQTIQNPSGNLLPVNYSFEGRTDTRRFPVGFRAFMGEGDVVEVQKGGARTGEKVLWMERFPPEEGEAGAVGVLEAIYGNEIAVTPDTVYELSAYASPGALDGVAGVKIVWLSAKNPTFRRESFGSLVSSEDEGFTRVSVKAKVPLGASHVEAVCFLRGKQGGVHFDDLELFEVSGDDTGVLQAERLEVRVAPNGLFSLRRRGGMKDFVRDGQLLLIGKRGKTWQRYAKVEKGPSGGDGSSIEVQGKIYEFSSGTWVDFTETVSIREGRIALDYRVEGEAGVVSMAGLSFSPAPERIAEGVGIVTEQSYQVMTDVFQAEEVTRMLWGRSRRPLSFNYDPPVTCIQVRENEQVLILQVVPPPAEGSTFRIAVELQSDFKEAESEIRSALFDARDAENAGNPGEAISRLRDVLVKYPFLKMENKSDHKAAGEETAEEWLARLEKEAADRKEKIRTRFELAQFFRNVREMEASLGDAEHFLEIYGGSEWEEDVRALAERIRLAIHDERVQRGQRSAEGFLLRARERAERDEASLARLLYAHVVKTWPGTEWAKTAEEEMKALAGE